MNGEDLAESFILEEFIMLIERLRVVPEGTDFEGAELKCYIQEGERQRPGVLICPGGAYSFLSPREDDAVALQFAAAGFHVFVLYYTVQPDYYRRPLLELAEAVKMVRSNAKEWNLIGDQIAVCGFSAGGHLAASLGVHWHKLESASESEPKALILSYPVITSGKFKHAGSITNLLGPNPTNEQLLEMSLEKQVTSQTPPTFLWHTVADPVVPVENSLMFASALQANGRPFELHIYPNGPHGLSLAITETDDSRGTDPHVATWLGLCIEWLKGLFQFD